ncbi:MAG: hypothetical protein LBR16_00420, partial [Treponema sp.]|nr:hypothetical protein [Treponema sp.]
QAVQAEENLKWQKLRESQQETERHIRESQDRTDRQMQETDRKLRESQERTDKRISRLGNRIGDLIELFAAANVIEKFQALGFEFTQASQNMKIQDKNHNDLAEVDIFLENGDYVMALEVKTNLCPIDVTEHLQRMDVLRTYADSRGDKRQFLGAIAVALASKGVRELALSSGFYLLEQQGDNVRITAPENRRVW